MLSLGNLASTNNISLSFTGLSSANPLTVYFSADNVKSSSSITLT